MSRGSGASRAGVVVLAMVALAGAERVGAQAVVRHDFEEGLGTLVTYGVNAARIAESGDPAHGRVLVLRPNGDAHVLVPGTESWSGVRLEGEVLFPTEGQSYLGLLYNVRRTGDRFDFGNVYIKGNDSYLQANPHRDYNVSRLLYPEWQVPLVGASAVEVGRWQRFKLEVVGRVAHVYVGDMDTPVMVFPDFEGDTGAVGLQPRSVGAEVWVDNLVATPIDGLGGDATHPGDPMPYDRSALLVDWSVLGPLEQTLDAVAREPDGGHAWRAFETDRRGAVVTGSVVDTHGPRTVAYFRSVVEAEAGPAVLHLSTADALALWVNGRFYGFYGPNGRAWPDFWRNPDHRGIRVGVDLVGGANDIVLRVRGGVYASGGFFARVERR